METQKSKGAVLTGLIAALAASSCCVPPLIALIAGVGGGASSLSWMEPLRPYLVGLAVIAIGYAWYSHLKTKKAEDCGCDIEKPKFYQTKKFLIAITLFSIISITLPYYSNIFYSNNKREVIISSPENVQEVKFNIEGMTCASCEEHVIQAINKLPGIISVTANAEKGISEVKYDKSKSIIKDIVNAIDGTGYKVSSETITITY